MFQPGRVYHRRDELHAQFKGQQYGGISTPATSPVILLFTGDEGNAFGYHDGWQVAGLYHYSGEGQVGDQQFVKGNKSIRDHALNGKDLHLFEKLADTQYRYIGQFVYAGDHMVRAPDRDGNERDVIMFELLPIEAVDEAALEASTSALDSASTSALEPAVTLPHSLEDLHATALSGVVKPGSADSRRVQVRRRSAAVARYARVRAGGMCESCGSPAPFPNPLGEPFLEVHHLRRMSDGGPDHPRWVAAVCPNCHRRAHHGSDANDFNGLIIEVVGAREIELGHLT